MKTFRKFNTADAQGEGNQNGGGGDDADNSLGMLSAQSEVMPQGSNKVAPTNPSRTIVTRDYGNATEDTYGKSLVRTGFNPSNNGVIGAVKMSFAKAIDEVYYLPYTGELVEKKMDDFTRYQQRAIDDLETAAMYAVKAATIS